LPVKISPLLKIAQTPSASPRIEYLNSKKAKRVLVELKERAARVRIKHRDHHSGISADEVQLCAATGPPLIANAWARRKTKQRSKERILFISM
jgi:hypothetical protein